MTLLLPCRYYNEPCGRVSRPCAMNRNRRSHLTKKVCHSTSCSGRLFVGCSSGLTRRVEMETTSNRVRAAFHLGNDLYSIALKLPSTLGGGRGESVVRDISKKSLHKRRMACRRLFGGVA